MISNHEPSLIRVVVLHINLSPFSFLYLSLYFCFMFFLFCCDNFVIFWLIIEVITLLLIGICFSIFTNRYSYLIIYFLIQSISSFSLLILFLADFYYLFLIFFLLKLSMFPFHFWYINVAYRFSAFPLFLVSTFHKIPSFVILPLFRIPINSFFYLSLVVTIFISSFYMFSCSDLRILLVSSSVGNNSWFFLSSLVSLDFFLLYVLFYSFNFYFILFSFSPLSSLSYSFSRNFSPLVVILLLISISGMPPFPLFFLKSYALYVLSPILPLCLFFCLFFTFLIVSSYIIFTFKLLSYRFSSHVLFML